MKTIILTEEQVKKLLDNVISEENKDKTVKTKQVKK
jgi:hypothetical protein